MPDKVGSPTIHYDAITNSVQITNSYPTIVERSIVGQEDSMWETVNVESVSKACVDYNIENGQTYVYRNTKAATDQLMISDTVSISIDYDAMSLQDANRLLKITFNPKITSMKQTILESKSDTIGGRYPVFYRNANVCYREFPISGLISYLSDDDEQFILDTELGLSANQPRTTSLTSYNINAERIFRDTVLSWLTNGKPKLFKSATEGCFIVRLMNVSLSPNDTLGRMIWSFNATAYQIADTTYENIEKYDLVFSGVN